MIEAKFDQWNIQYIENMNDLTTILYTLSKFSVLDKDSAFSAKIIKYILDNPELLEKGYNNLHSLFVCMEPHVDVIKN